MTETRSAGPGDIDELVRFRAVLLSEWFDTSDPEWRAMTAAALARRLVEPSPTMHAVVVDAPDGSGRLASCAIGTVSERLPNPRNPSGLYGWVFNVVTEDEWRRRGYGRACMDALIEWFRANGVGTVELLATDKGLGLYEQLGFTVSDEPAMRLST
ncbi:GNAT family N-acetyltransferase [Glycomyces sp. NPDC047010]|uniref:GNAT family N-acetyltransferase n=1 Tax=Glycomyces sp. NPDC047010 TaxID=3155023 RepID=UPI00340779EA